MSLYCIGKLQINNKKTPQAYKIYNSATNEAKLITRVDVINAMRTGIKINGLYHRIDYKGCSLLVFNKNVPNIDKLDEVDNLGNLLKNPSSYTLIGIKHFQEDRIFIVIDANCNKYEFNIQEIKGKSIIGLSQANNSIRISPKYTNQVY